MTLADQARVHFQPSPALVEKHGEDEEFEHWFTVPFWAARSAAILALPVSKQVLVAGAATAITALACWNALPALVVQDDARIVVRIEHLNIYDVVVD